MGIFNNSLAKNSHLVVFLVPKNVICSLGKGKRYCDPEWNWLLIIFG